MNSRPRLECGESYARIPLRKASRIVRADALETAWADVPPPQRWSFVLGNPPFAGAKHQTPAQPAQVRRIAAPGGSGGTPDCVAAWFAGAAACIREGAAEIRFVATNSIAQGEQTGRLWPVLLERHGMEISFAHRAFAWVSEARGQAHVHVVTVGLRRQGRPGPKRLFSYAGVHEVVRHPQRTPATEPEETARRAISPYLLDASRPRNPRLAVREASRPLNGLPRPVIGSKRINGGHYVFTASERERFLAEEPGAEGFRRPHVGGREFLAGMHRWILAPHDAPSAVLGTLPKVAERVAAVRAYRLPSPSAPTKALADRPTAFHVRVIPSNPSLIVPGVGSERPVYGPISWMEPPEIPSDAATVLDGAPSALVGPLMSAMHMSWLRLVGGRLENRYRSSISLVYNAFPLPPGSQAAPASLGSMGDAILHARAEHPEASLSDLYDPTLMPTRLRATHRRLDQAVDRLYRRAGFASDRERAEQLLALYERKADPPTDSSGPEERRHRTASRGKQGRSR